MWYTSDHWQPNVFKVQSLHYLHIICCFVSMSRYILQHREIDKYISFYFLLIFKISIQWGLAHFLWYRYKQCKMYAVCSWIHSGYISYCPQQYVLISSNSVCLWRTTSLSSNLSPPPGSINQAPGLRINMSWKTQISLIKFHSANRMTKQQCAVRRSATLGSSRCHCRSHPARPKTSPKTLQTANLTNQQLVTGLLWIFGTPRR